jgi:flagellum-specific peptidoglycan hydrolase FlgJ
VHPVRKPTWQQATALVSLSTCGAMTGFSFTHGTVADMTSPASMPVHLVDFSKPARTASASASASASADDSTLRAAIINVANYYLRMAQSKTPAEMEAAIWQQDSVDGVDHGESCAAFASLTLELGAKAAGQESWVTGGTSYPWPLQPWADVRVDENPASPGVISIVQDAEAHDRWHPLGDGYRPQPGDWVLFNGHVEVVTKYANGVLYTIGGDSLPNFTVNAHQFSVPLAGQGVVGFVNNGAAPVTQSADQQARAKAANRAGQAAQPSPSRAVNGQAAIPGMLAAALSTSDSKQPAGATARAAGGTATRQRPTASTQAGRTAAQSGDTAAQSGGTAAIPGLQAIQDEFSSRSATSATPGYGRKQQPTTTIQVPGTAAQQAFISQVAPGAMAAQVRYGIPAAVTIAQAIDESGWGQSVLAVRDHNLFGIKGTGPAGSDLLPTQEFEDGRWVTQTDAFKVYHNVAESIADHSQLLATGSSYVQAMADRHVPDAFAADLTGVYATDPSYGTNLIALMRLYNLYRYSPSATAEPDAASASSSADHGGSASQGGDSAGQAAVPGQGTTAGLGGGSGNTGTAGRGGATIPGVLDAFTTPAAPAAAMTVTDLAAAEPSLVSPATDTPVKGEPQLGHRPGPRIAPRRARVSSRRYVSQIPRAVTADFVTTAKAPLARAEPLYRDVATESGIRWELLAACDWMQCKAQPRYSPVRGEKLGTVNSDGTVYHTKSAALAQTANDLIDLAMAVYWIDITARRPLSVRNLANVFAAFRWGGLLKLHNVSAMEFPYSVEGLTAQHIKMRWPVIKESNPPDKPGARFRLPFGAVPVVLSLEYPAVAELSTADR